MLRSEDLKIKMVEGDYGIVLPIIITAESELTQDDKFSIKIYKEINGEPLISKEYSDIKNNTIEFKLTEEESLQLPVGQYYYDLDWYQDNSFLSNLLKMKKFIVEEKAGAVNGSQD